MLDGIRQRQNRSVFAVDCPGAAAGRQALVLVPKSTSPRSWRRAFARVFRTPTVCLHKQSGRRARAQTWLAAAWEGRARLVIGTRLAVFTRCLSWGWIVVDEEHDGSFKQQDGLRYHARDLAVWRAWRNRPARWWCWAQPRPRWKAWRRCRPAAIATPG